MYENSKRKKTKYRRFKKHGKSFKYNCGDDEILKSKFCFYKVENPFFDKENLNEEEEQDDLQSGVLYSINKKGRWNYVNDKRNAGKFVVQYRHRNVWNLGNKHMYAQKDNEKEVRLSEIDRNIEKFKEKKLKKGDIDTEFQSNHGKKFDKMVLRNKNVYVLQKRPKAMFVQGRWNRGNVEWRYGDDIDSRRRRRKRKKEVHDFLKGNY